MPVEVEGKTSSSGVISLKRAEVTFSAAGEAESCLFWEGFDLKKWRAL